MTKHTKEPWHIDGEKIRANLPDGGKRMIGTVDDPLNILRVTQCVNALAGIEDPAATLKAVRELIEKAHGDDHLNHPLVANCDGFDQWKATRELLREALALLKGEA